MGLLKRHHRRSLLQAPFPKEWEAILSRDVPYLERFNDVDSQRLRDTIQIIVDEKFWEGCGGLQIDDQIRVVIAAQAAIMLLRLESTDYLHNVRTFLIYPGPYQQTQERVGSDGLVHSGTANLGEAWYNGPVVLSWPDALAASKSPGQGRNVVMHELAHSIDMLTGSVNGTPLLRNKSDYSAWQEVMGRTFQELREKTALGQPDVLRPYALTNAAEFFAVSTECFFDAPATLRSGHPEVYAQFTRFWGWDPANPASLHPE